MMQNTELNNFNLVSKYWKKKILNKEKVFVAQGKQYSLNSIVISAEELNYFNRLTNKNPIAQYTVISAVCSFLLKKLINEFDGYVVSDYKEQYNSLLLSFPVDLNTSFKEFLGKVKYEILETLKYSDYNNDLVANKELRELGILSNYGINVNSGIKSDCQGILLEITIDESENLVIKASYLEDFTKKTILERLIQYFKYFIVNLEADLEINLSEYQLLSKKEKHQLLIQFNATDQAYPKDKTIVDLFEEQVEKTPNNIAIIFEESKLTYTELNKKANQLANHIFSKHIINKGDIIGVLLPKSDIGIISLLAILKLGAVYLPIDINYPQERIDYLINDSDLKLLINDNSRFKIDNCDIINLKAINFDDCSISNIKKVISSNDLAYVIYTSGSTGHPKGVMVEHTSNVNMSLHQIDALEITESDKVLWFASVAFDASISEIMMSLYSGATLCIPTEEIIKNKDQFISFLKETKASVATFPPSYLGLLSENDISGLRCIITAGESANPTKAISVVQSGINYYNAYGPTECAVCVSIYKVKADDFTNSIISIGKPISNTQIYILDDYLQPIAIGVTGKLYISGTGLAKGYLNKPELTAEKFIANPFVKGERMYDTGDLGRWLSDGNIEFLGRKDHQIKIRGYRIELGEIESKILQFSEDLKQVAVEAKENNQEKVLVAYLVSSEGIEKSELRSFLQEKLPDYMVPGFYVELEKLPLTANGKIDRKALPTISAGDIIRKDYEAPRNELERSLVEIWQDVLGIEKVGITDNFFELGGHSLIVAQVINRTHKQLGKTVSFKAFFASPTIDGLSKVLQKNEYSVIPKARESVSYPLTASQSRLWILSQLEGGSLAYNMPAAVKLRGAVHANKFEESFIRLIHRHEILRTYFKTNEEGIVRQYILSEEQVKFKIENRDYSAAENQDEATADYLQQRNREPFDLDLAPLVRASLIKLKEDEYVFFLSLHHIIGDGWSIEILISEVVKIYSALTLGEEIDLPELSLQYKDYAVWLNDEMQREKQQEAEDYWLQQFEGELPVLELPSFKTRPLVQTYNGESLTRRFPREFLDELKTFSKEQDLTLFITLMTGINALLHRYTGNDDIIIGTPIAGRKHPDLENQMGLYLNTLAIRTQLKKDISFLDLAVTQKETLLGAYEYQSYPFDALVGKLDLKRDISRSALFDVLVVLQNQGQLNNLNNKELANFQVSGYEFSRKTSQFDVSFIFAESDGLDLTIEYNTDIYDSYLIERMFTHFENLVRTSLEHPQKLIQEIDYFTAEEKHQLLAGFNDTEAAYPKDKTIIDLFEEQVEKTPDNIAILFGDTVLTYRQLNEQSNQLGLYLRENYSVQPEDLIGVKLERSDRLIVTIIGILKSGAAYVPIDTAYPQERVNYIEKDSNCRVVIDNKFLKLFDEVQENYGTINLTKNHKSNNLAYIIYTSGTTGNPKGVMIEHSNASELINWSITEYKFNGFDIAYAVTSHCFDLSIYEFFYPLSIGKKIRILKNALEIKDYLHTDKKVLLNTVPSVIRKIIDDEVSLDNVKIINMAGEILPTDIIDKLPLDKMEVRNLYGPSEDTTYSTCYLIKNNNYKTISIGSPISNTQILILDEHYNFSPIGVSGKIFISGAGVARGYLNKPELTVEKFRDNPFVQDAKMYDTGDLGRWLPDGNIEFLGRRDHQVKIRGYRIELGEIEDAILKYSENLKQIVVESKELNQEKVLVAYLISTTKINKSELKNFLQEKLPDYMIPSFYMELEKLPLTPNGKVNREALPGISGNDIIRKKYVAPRNDIENKLVIIWQEILGVQKIGITDDLFELGGNSLSVTRLISLMNKEFEVKISISDLFRNRLLEDQAVLIENILVAYGNDQDTSNVEVEKFSL